MQQTTTNAAAASPITTDGPNMTKEHKRELADLERQIRAAKREQQARHKQAERDIRQARELGVRAIRSIATEQAKLDRGTEKLVLTIQKRQAILLGRLSS